MKKLFNVTVGGLYLCSVVLGVLVFLLTLTAPHDMLSWAYHQRREEFGFLAVQPLSIALRYLPLDDFYCYVYSMLHNVPAFSVTLAILIVALAVMMIDGRGTNGVWRTKVLQATGIAGALVCVELAYSYSFWVYCQEMSPMMMLIPVMLLVIPLLILKKTWLPKEARPKKAKTVTGIRKLKKKLIPKAVGSVGAGVPMEVTTPHGTSDDSNMYDS